MSAENTTETTTTESTDDTKKNMKKGEASKHAAKFAFSQLYNSGESYPDELYFDTDGDQFEPKDCRRVYEAYTGVLVVLAAKAGIGAEKKTQTTFDV